MISPRGHCSDKSLQFLKVDRLGQVMLEAGVQTSPDILLHTKTTQCDAHQRLPGLGGAHDVTTVAIGQSDVANQPVKTLVFEKFNRGLDTFGSQNFMALLSQKRSENAQGLGMVIYHEQLQAAGWAMICGGMRDGCNFRAIDGGETKFERSSPIKAFAVNADRSSLQLEQPL